MADLLGRFCLVLHGHLPYVLHHGVHPHGEAWLYEAAAETYLPLLDLLDELASLDAPVNITLGLTPVLLAQFASERFKRGFVVYLNERIDRANQDRREFERDGDAVLAALANRWLDFYRGRLKRFRALEQNLPMAFARHVTAGRVELLTGPITHGYLPLLGQERSIAAQLRGGTALTEQLTGIRPSGVWLPECAYRPAYARWKPPVLNGEVFFRPGLQTHLAARGLTHFIVDTHLIEHATPVGIVDAKGFQTTTEALVYWDQKRGWKSPLDPVGVVDKPHAPDVYAFARHPKVSEQVWSGAIGYPGSAEYLDFHFTHGEHGLRYRQVTDHHSGPELKLPYDPALAPGKVFEHAQHFCNVVKQALTDYTATTGRIGTVVAPFDAELFGHWWFEGPKFLRDVLLAMAHDPQLEVVTTESVLSTTTIDKVVQLPEGSWGEGGHHHVWLNDQTRWLWECEYRAENRMLTLIDELPWQTQPVVRDALRSAARELLLQQSSDWPFAIHAGVAADYGITRFSEHYTRFNRLATIAERLASGAKLTTVERSEKTEADLHDSALGEINLDWFRA